MFDNFTFNLTPACCYISFWSSDTIPPVTEITTCTSNTFNGTEGNICYDITWIEPVCPVVGYNITTKYHSPFSNISVLGIRVCLILSTETIFIQPLGEGGDTGVTAEIVGKGEFDLMH